MKNNNIKQISIIIITAMLLIPYLCIALGNDEPFTMGIIRHSYHQIIYLTSLDIHPPLYFILLKSFLSITTFWTDNIFIHIFFARILSLSLSIVSLIFIKKMLSLLNININFISSLLIFLMLPLELGLSQETTNIRMYSLTIMLFSILMYYSIKYVNNPTNIDLFIIFIVLSASLYTQYVAGFISGLYLILISISLFIDKRFKKSLHLAITGMLSLITFLPWLPSFFNQMSYQQNPGSKTLMIKFLIEVITITLIFLVPYIKCKKIIGINYRYIFVIPLSITLFSIVISLSRFIVSGGMISARYLSPILVPYSFISIILLTHIEKKNNRILKYIIILFVTCCMGISLFRQVKRYFIPQFSFLSKFEKIQKNKSKDVDINKEHLNKYYWDQGDGGGGNAIYLLSINKEISNKNYMNTYTTLGNGNPKLFKSLFPNIRHFTDINPSKEKRNKR